MFARRFKQAFAEGSRPYPTTARQRIEAIARSSPEFVLGAVKVSVPGEYPKP